MENTDTTKNAQRVRRGGDITGKRIPIGTRVKVVETRSHRGRVGTVTVEHGEIGGDVRVTIRDDSGDEFRVYTRQVVEIR